MDHRKAGQGTEAAKALKVELGHCLSPTEMP